MLEERKFCFINSDESITPFRTASIFHPLLGCLLFSLGRKVDSSVVKRYQCNYDTDGGFSNKTY
jgi:hypothetical protein